MVSAQTRDTSFTTAIDAHEVQLEGSSNSSNESSSVVREGDSSTKDVIAAAQWLQQQQYTEVEAVAFTIKMPEKINTRSLMSVYEEIIFLDITLAFGIQGICKA